MSDSKENEEAGQGVPAAVEEDQQLVDVHVEVVSDPVTVEEASNNVENGMDRLVSESSRVENEKEDPPAEDTNAKLEAVKGSDNVGNGTDHLESESNQLEQEKTDPPAAEDTNAKLEAVTVEEDSDNVGNGTNHVEHEKEDPPAAEDTNVKLEAVTVEEDSNNVENGTDHLESESNHVENETAEPPAEDSNAKLEAVTVEEDSNNVENGANHLESESNHVECGKAEPPAEDTHVKLEAVSEDIPQEYVQDTLHNVPVEADVQVFNTTECEAASDAKAEAEEFPQSTKGVSVHQSGVSDADTTMDAETTMGAETTMDAEMTVDAERTMDAETTVDAETTMDAEMTVDTEFPQITKGVENDDSVHQNGVSDADTAMDAETTVDADIPQSNKGVENDDSIHQNGVSDADTMMDAETMVEVKPEVFKAEDSKTCDNVDPMPSGHNDPTMLHAAPADTKSEFKNVLEVEKADEKQATEPSDNGNSNSKNMFFLDPDHFYDGNESGTEEDQSAFMKELENFFRERSMEFKPPKFYGEGLNCLKLWRSVTRLGGYDKVTSCKLWRQVGESFKPPKTCTTVSWTFRGFYEKALLDYERHNIKGGELNVPIASQPEPMNIENQVCIQASVSGRARRDAAARAMQGWHSQRLLGNGEVSDPIIKDRNSVPVQKREKQLKSINLLKRKKPSYMDNAVKAARSKPSKPQLDTVVIDIGPPAEWVKVNVQKTKDCFEIYALVPGLLREEVRVQSDPAGRLVISGEPEHPNNPWGVTPFKKVVSLPSRIDPHQTSAVVTLHGQVFIRVPFEQSE
ncbi:AT-rich interactive domain-containing protein 5-like isoform X2 [Lotus japonicus]|uniref:AT-rich interactive domain-containing protein 5-like isoform X2 n=1 Tax=Lotus japonicus TaxID=34305 RepID=UPI0025903557|nr:AT-rich interactive domain-containing protein 5-like isoform X2 [Lotus japonicus]